ncbi:glycosyltransferase [Flammeovirga kamogawensis]|uniref:Glycosyltransferase n=1 Tax=Flammeovirga kamogawensis TaxID=373891 RepID=A0ABX8GT54_9BACT|nr:glycosyltransferase [Flammeovirga kamogawensis]MBB6461526.1 glycosyltransferase involved in cell wall biosynthesis [Flammeovirga kamogawensis]QWG06417.1 glycosyltransferase [Flammeovirga kamogawensis]TRX68246.1 glycosyltransferase family 4 protein [Flammeovirga kamogawensis]
MRVLVIPSWYPPNGGQFFKNQILALKQECSNLEVDVIYCQDDSLRGFSILKLLENNSFKIHKKDEDGILTYRIKSWSLPFFEKISSKLWCIKMFFLFKEYVKDTGFPDLIHVHSSLWGGEVAYNIKTKYNIPYVITEHRGRFIYNNSLSMSMFKPWYDKRLKKIFENASFTIPVGSNMSKKISNYIEKGSNTTIVPIPNQVDVSKFNIDYEIKKYEEFTFISIAYLVEVKRFDILISAFNNFQLKYPKSKLVIIGSGPLESKLKTQVDELNIHSKVVFLGYKNPFEINYYLNRSHAFALASSVEAQGVVTVEAMCTGLPVLGTDTLSPENIPNGTGVTVKSEDINAFTNGMINIYENYSHYNKEKIRDIAVSTFSEKVIASRIFEIYKKTLSH